MYNSEKCVFFLLPILFAVVVLVQCKNRLAENVLKNLKKISDDKDLRIIFGHQYDLNDGQHCKIKDCSDVLISVNDYPGIVGYNFVDILTETHEDPNFLRLSMLDAYSLGMLLTIDFRAYNPCCPNFLCDEKNITGNPIINLLPGKDCNSEWNRYLDVFVNFFKSVTTKEGVQIPVLFRLFHECLYIENWWSSMYASSEQYIAAYKYTMEYLEKQGLDGIISVFAPERPGVHYETWEEYGERFPDADICAFDHYGPGDEPMWRYNLTNDAKIVVPFAITHGKIPALAEWGALRGTQTVTRADWWTAVLQHLKENEFARHLAYAVTWTNSHPHNYWVPLSGQLTYDDFVEFYEDPTTIFLKNMPDMYAD